MLKEQDKAPLDIAVKNLQEENVSLSSLLGKFVVLYFYPEDNTLGCTKEACSFRDFNEDIKGLGAEIIGVSKDSIKSHKKFIEDHNLNFTLWSDPELKLLNAFGVWGDENAFYAFEKKLRKLVGARHDVSHVSGTTIRATFLINREGVIVKVWPKVNPLNHAEEVYNTLRTLT